MCLVASFENKFAWDLRNQNLLLSDIGVHISNISLEKQFELSTTSIMAWRS